MGLGPNRWIWILHAQFLQSGNFLQKFLSGPGACVFQAAGRNHENGNPEEKID
jgi:hypothetical protein